MNSIASSASAKVTRMEPTPAPLEVWTQCKERSVDIFRLTKTDRPAGSTEDFSVPQCCKIPASNLPDIDHDYIFNHKNLFNIWLWLNTNRPLLLFGEPGLGKSTLIEQMAARLLVPLSSITCTRSTEVMDLIGSRSIVVGTSGFDYGPLINAYRYGYWFLLDEIDALDASIAYGLYPFLERRAVTIPETGDVIKPHPRFRLAATANTNGLMDETGLHTGSQRQSIAHMDRYIKVKAEHFSKADELKILRKKVSGLPDETLSRMVDVAWDIRAAYMNPKSKNQLDVTCSPRAVITWAQLWSQAERLSMHNINVPIYTLNLAFGNLASSATKQAIAETVGAYFPLKSTSEELDNQ